MTTNYPRQYEIWVADLESATGSEPGKVRPVIILQADTLNKAGHTSFILCPMSSQIKQGVSFLRIEIEPNSNNGLLKTSYVLCDQIRAIDMKRLKGRIGFVSDNTITRINETLKAILSI